MDTDLEMYLEFRKHLDMLCFPEIVRHSDYQHIMCGEALAGFLLVEQRYVTALYVKPEYRRKGLGRKAVVTFLAKGGQMEPLHILNNNKPAKKFWNSLFDLNIEAENDIETLYRIYRMKPSLIAEVSKADY